MAPHLSSRISRIALVVLTALAPTAVAATRAELVARMTAWTGLTARSVVAVTPEIVVALVGRGTPDSARTLVGVQIEGEIVDEATAEARGWRSMRTRLDVACTTRMVRIAEMRTFTRRNGAGEGVPHKAPADWTQPSPGAYLGDVVTALCGAQDPGLRGLRGFIAESLSQSPDPVSAPGADMAAASPVAPRPAAPTRLSEGVRVQIAAAPGPGEAQAALDGFIARTPLADGLRAQIEPATVGGRALQRVLIGGFASVGEARRYCANLRANGGDCFVR